MYHLHCAACGAFIAATKDPGAAAGTHYCNKHRRPLTEEQLRMLEALQTAQGSGSDEDESELPEEETVTIEEPVLTVEEPPAPEPIPVPAPEEPALPEPAELAPDLLPDDFPAVELLRENGLGTYTAVAAHTDLTDINGIGQATAERILEALP